jgi:simple sugar transport system ATP-binding protein
MVGRDLAPKPPRPATSFGRGDARELLHVDKLSARRADGSLAVDDVSLSVRAGEILGVAGVEGNGQSELVLAIAGLLPAAQLVRGRVLIDGYDVSHKSVRVRRALGLAHIPEDRQQRGAILDFSVADNVRLGRLGLDRRGIAADSRRIIERLDVRPPDAGARLGALSGGNQQKVVVGRELGADPAVLLCAQPTRGVDVGAIERIHHELAHARIAGRAVLLVSADLDELLALSDRIGVLYRGRVAGCVDNLPERRAQVRAEVGALMLGTVEASAS